jgi:hypothetical protein
MVMSLLILMVMMMISILTSASLLPALSIHILLPFSFLLLPSLSHYTLITPCQFRVGGDGFHAVVNNDMTDAEKAREQKLLKYSTKGTADSTEGGLLLTDVEDTTTSTSKADLLKIENVYR